MASIRSFLAACILLVHATVSGQQGLNLLHDFGTDPDTQSAALFCYADTNQCFIFGNTRTLNVLNRHGYLASLDYSGNVMWTQKILAGSQPNGSSSYNGITKLGTNRYVTIGTIFDYKIKPPAVVWQPYFYIFAANGDSVRFIVKTDSFRTRTFNAVLADRHSIITAGVKTDTAQNPLILWLCKYDTLGNLVWEKDYLNNPFQIGSRPNSIILSADGNHYVIAGAMYDSVASTFGTCIMKTDTNGNVVWLKRLKRPNVSEIDMDIVANPAGGYYFVGSYSTLPDVQGIPQGSNVYYGKLDEQGDTVWTRTFQDSLYRCMGYQVRWSNDHQHLLLRAENGYDVPALIKIDTNGNVAWYHLMQYFYNWKQQYLLPIQLLRSISVTPDERYLMVGAIGDTHIPGVLDMNGAISWIILTDSSGCRYAGDPSCWPVSVKNTLAATKDIHLYPNPTSGHFTIETPQNGILHLYDMDGREVVQYSISNRKEQLSLAPGLQPGIYIAKFMAGNGDVTVLRLLYER